MNLQRNKGGGDMQKVDHEEAKRLREAGLTYAQIGRVLGVSKQRARQIVVGPPKKPDLDSKRMLRVGDVAQLLGVHVNTVRHWSDRGVLKPFVISNRGDRRFKREDIDSFIKEGENPVATAALYAEDVDLDYEKEKAALIVKLIGFVTEFIESHELTDWCHELPECGEETVEAYLIPKREADDLRAAIKSFLEASV